MLVVLKPKLRYLTNLNTGCTVCPDVVRTGDTVPKLSDPDPFYDGAQEKIVPLEDPGEVPDEVGTSGDSDGFIKNDLLIPSSIDRRRRCPACGCLDFSGRNLGGVLNFTCLNKSCGAKWAGGLPMVPEDPRKPQPFKETPAGISFERNPKMPDKWLEVHKPVDTTQPFRKGVKLPDGE